MGLPLLLLALGCEATNEIDGTVDGATVTVTSAWWVRYVSTDGTEHPQYRISLSSMEDGCGAITDYLADKDLLDTRYDNEELAPEDYVVEAEELFAQYLPSDLWQIVIEFLVQEGDFTELRLDGSDWDRYPQTNEIAANFVHQEGLRYSGADMTQRFISHEGTAELTYDESRGIFEGDFLTSVADYSTGQIFEEVTVLYEVEVCEGLRWDDAAVWW